MDWKGRFAAFGVVAAALLAIEDMLVPAIALPLLVLATRLWRCSHGHRWLSGAQGQQQSSRGAAGRPGVKCHEHADV